MGLTLMFLRTWLAAQTSRFMKDEDGAADIIAIVLIVAVVIALAFIFKEKIVELLGKLFPSGEGVASDLQAH